MAPSVGLFFGTLLFGLISQNARAAIIGDNNLLDWHEVSDVALRDASRATAVLIKKSHNWLQHQGDGWSLSSNVPSFAKGDGICSGEQFRQQPAPGECSGFLIGRDTLATANHCLEFMGCANIVIAFDFIMQTPGQTKFEFGPDSIFQCAAVVAKNEFEDWAILKLDRIAARRDPLRMNPVVSTRGVVGTATGVFGYPRGLPLKIAGGAIVRMPSGVIDADMVDDYYEADLDVFGGTSGAPVVNLVTGEVEGILTTGFGEFEDPAVDPLSGEECYRLRRIPAVDDATLPWITRARGIERQNPEDSRPQDNF